MNLEQELQEMINIESTHQGYEGISQLHYLMANDIMNRYSLPRSTFYGKYNQMRLQINEDENLGDC